MSVTDHIDKVLGATGELAEIRTRLRNLDEERAALESRAQRILEELTGAANGAVHFAQARAAVSLVPPPPATRFSLTDRIVQHLDSHPGQMYGAVDLAFALGLSGESNVNTIRGTLSRLKHEGRISKSAFGKYRSKQQEDKEENAPPVTE